MLCLVEENFRKRGNGGEKERVAGRLRFMNRSEFNSDTFRQKVRNNVPEPDRGKCTDIKTNAGGSRSSRLEERTEKPPGPGREGGFANFLWTRYGYLAPNANFPGAN